MGNSWDFRADGDATPTFKTHPTGYQAGDEAQQEGGRQRDEPLAAEGPEPQVARQLAEAQLVQQRREPADQQQGQEDDDHPADHACS
jgi:hypothetical protein